jgi:hypothetical protein
MPLPCQRRRRHNPFRRPLVGLFAVTLCLWFARPAEESPFLAWVAAAVDRDDFRIVDPDEDRKLDAAAPKAARKYDTFAHRVLDIDAGEAPVSAEKYALLDGLIDDLKGRVTYDATVKDPKAQRKQALRVLRAIDDVLTARNFLYPPGDFDVVSLRSALAPQTLDGRVLERVLRVGENQRRREHAREQGDGPFYVIDCDTSSFVYIGLAEALGVELKLVDLPDHMFVRWELADGSHVNWDTNGAEAITDREYAEDYGLGKRLRKKRVYLASMTRAEAEGFAYFLRGSRWEERGEDARAIADLEKARTLYPQCTMLKSDLAWLYATAAGVDAARRKQALGLAQEAVALEPDNGDFWDTLAAAHAADGDFDRAVRHAEKAERLAESPDDRAEFRAHRKAYEKGRMPATGAAAGAAGADETRRE